MWELARRQHGVVTREQLQALGLTRSGIDRRIRTGRLHQVYPGVYAVGRPELSQLGRWMAAVLACGAGAVLSHSSAAQLWGVQKTSKKGVIHVTIPPGRRARHTGIRVYRRTLTSAQRARSQGIPLTAITQTLVDQATIVPRKHLEAAVNEADKLDLIDPQSLRDEIAHQTGRPGVRTLRTLLDETTLTLTDSELERLFLPIAERAGLPPPETQSRLRGFRVDFHWLDLKLVVETDGLRYHRTPAQQAKDRYRDQRLTAAGLTVLRFTHAQVVHDPEQVVATLKAVAAWPR